MTRDDESRLIEFAVRQQGDFAQPDWLVAPNRLRLSAEHVAAAAWLLSSHPRYGHAIELQQAARALSNRDQLELLRASLLEPARFTSMVDHGIQFRKVQA